MGMVEINKQSQSADVIRLPDLLDRSYQAVIWYDLNQAAWQPDEIRFCLFWESPQDGEPVTTMVLQESLPSKGQGRLVGFARLPYGVFPANLRHGVRAFVDDIIDPLLLRRRERGICLLVSMED
jgi:hypothetical protein